MPFRSTRLLTIPAIVAAFILLSTTAIQAAEPAKMTITAQPLGDSADGIVLRITFRYPAPQELQMGVPLVVTGSVTEGNAVVKRFRYDVDASSPDSLSATFVLPVGSAQINASLMVPLEEETPVVVAKGEQTIDVVKTGSAFHAGEGAAAEEILAEGAIPQNANAVRIVPPRRDLALNLFAISVETSPIVKKVEFWVDGKKIMTRNEAPYRAELDLGRLPKRVEVKAVGYDEAGNYVDADSFVVNEHETPLEAKITRTVTPDGIDHFKVSVQNPKGTTIKSASLFIGNRKLIDWKHQPYAIDIPASKLEGEELVRVSIIDETNYEAADIVFLKGDQFSESIDVNLVELPVSVADAKGVPIGGLGRGDFHILEDGKPMTMTSFNFASNLPISAGLLIDHSGSMQPRMEATRKAASEFLKRIMRPEDKAFVAGFADDPAKSAPFVTNLASLQSQIDAIPEAHGSTSLYDSIITGLYRFRGVDGRKALIILTDGEDTSSRLPYEEMLTYVRTAHVPIYFIGIGLGLTSVGGKNKMKALAAETGGVTWFIGSVKELDATYVQLENELRSQYLLAYQTESTKKDQKYRTIEVKVDHPGATIRTIRGFIP